MSAFLMPSLGADMEAGTLVEWLKQPGDAVQRGDVVAVVETQKGAIEIEIFQSGTLDKILVQPGEKVPVGAALAEIRTNGEAPRTSGDTAASASRGRQNRRRPKSLRPLLRRHHRRRHPRGRAPAHHAGRAPPRGRARRRPHPGGRDRPRRRHHPGRHRAPEGRPGSRSAARKTGFDPQAMRQAIAAAMARSKREIPHYYLSTTIDMTAALDWLERANAERPVTERLLPGVLLLKAVALALREHGALNGFWQDGLGAGRRHPCRLGDRAARRRPGSAGGA